MSTYQEIDELTLRRAQRGDSIACRSLVELYQNRVFGFCLRVIGHNDTSLAQDAAQETFVDVFAKLSAFSSLGPARLSSWILTIAGRRSIDMVRVRSSQTRLLAAASQLHRREAEIGATFDLELAVQALTAEHRAVFILCDGYEFSYDEVAKGLQLPVGTVRSRLARARSSVRAALQSQIESRSKGAKQA
jgi:RNA polymerase sigma-70 factor, ECF subfamily